MFLGQNHYFRKIKLSKICINYRFFLSVRKALELLSVVSFTIKFGNKFFVSPPFSIVSISDEIV